MGGHALLHALVDLLLVHLTSPGVDVRLNAAHAAAEGGGVSCRTEETEYVTSHSGTGIKYDPTTDGQNQ